ncbi:MAG: hypothetical protein ACE5F9_07380 [Phycisphaerae bacterium]
MARKSVGFVDQHIEKVVLAVCALALVGIAGWYFAGDPYGADPQKVFNDARDASEQTRIAVQSARPPNPSSSNTTKSDADPLKELGRWFGANAEGLARIARIEPRPPRLQRFPTPLLPVAETADQDRHGLARIVAPGVPAVTSGTTTLDIPAPMLLRRLARGSEPKSVEPSKRSWVSVAAQVDLADQTRNFLAAGYKPGELALLVTGVQLQRKAVGEAGADWEFVSTFTPYQPLRRPQLLFPDGRRIDPASADAKDRFVREIQRRSEDTSAQDVIARTPMPPATEGEKGDPIVSPPIPIDPPLLDEAGTPTDPKDLQRDATQLAKTWLAAAGKALKGSRPYGEPDPDAARMLAAAAAAKRGADANVRERARSLLMGDIAAALKKISRPPPAADPRDPQKLMPLIAHDLTVVPGRTYIYRMRYEVYNVFAGNTDIMKKMDDARKLTLFSDWSPASRPVEVKSDTYFYLTRASDADRKQKRVQVTVFKIGSRGQVDKRTDTIQVGDVIGRKGTRAQRTDFTTDMVCVDIAFENRGGRSDAVMVYVDSKDGSLWERRYSSDRNDKRYRDLKTKSR